MNKFLTLIFVLLGHYTYAASWQENWALATECNHKFQFEESLQYLSLAIEDPDVNPFVYVDRAYLWLWKKQYEQAEKDVDFALASPKLSDFDRPEAHHAKFQTCYCLGKHDQGIEHMRIWRETSTRIAKFDEDENFFIIRNATTDDISKKIYYRYYNLRGLCDSIDDLKKIDESTWLIKKKKVLSETPQDCGCGCRGEKKNDLIQEKFGFFSDCYWSCEMAVYFASGVCATMPNIFCRVTCAALVADLSLNCTKCCDSGNFYATCVAPFTDMAGQMTCFNCFIEPDFL